MAYSGAASCGNVLRKSTSVATSVKLSVIQQHDDDQNNDNCSSSVRTQRSGFKHMEAPLLRQQPVKGLRLYTTTEGTAIHKVLYTLSTLSVMKNVQLCFRLHLWYLFSDFYTFVPVETAINTLYTVYLLKGIMASHCTSQSCHYSKIITSVIPAVGHDHRWPLLAVHSTEPVIRNFRRKCCNVRLSQFLLWNFLYQYSEAKKNLSHSRSFIGQNFVFRTHHFLILRGNSKKKNFKTVNVKEL